MHWEDLIFTIGSLIFIAALVPTIRGTAKPAISTSLLTGSVLATYAVPYFALGLWFALASGIVTSACWFFLAYQAWQQQK